MAKNSFIHTSANQFKSIQSHYKCHYQVWTRFTKVLRPGGQKDNSRESRNLRSSNLFLNRYYESCDIDTGYSAKRR